MAAKERFEPSVEQVTEKTAKLLLTEEEWAERNKSRIVADSSQSGGKSAGGGEHYVKKEKHWKPKNNGGENGRKPNLTSMGTPRRKGRCRKCGVYGHWGKECKKPPQKERQEVAHHANANGDGENGVLLVMQICNVV